ncbi:acyltransferase [Ammoniphilus sp. YIM 78166]|uniref:acyltransferase family protein n=1 Tax=Ammoniphilus sp. YIM 78166 TaxID=1644106 RepID=UPI00106FEE7D|nr:acyltransferase [Ammoniphilus sp. YIM 78166]
MGIKEVPRINFETLQLLRGVAAILIVFFHAFGENSIFVYGVYGVDLFFVLSGFIIMYTHHSDIGLSNTLRDFLIKRLVRIFPTYWMVTFCYITLVTISGHALSVEYIVKSLLLLPQDTLPIVGVAWSLQFELLFYLIFSLLILNKKIFYPMFWMWGLASMSFLFLPIELPKVLKFIFSPFNLEFLLGCIIALVIIKNKLSYKWIAGMGISTIIISFFLQYKVFFEVHRVIFWGVPFSILILGLVKLEIRRRVHIPRVLTYFGDASYSIYLTHLISLLVLEDIAEMILVENLILAKFLICALSIMLGCIFYSLFERKYYYYLKSKLVSKKKFEPASQELNVELR